MLLATKVHSTMPPSPAIARKQDSARKQANKCTSTSHNEEQPVQPRSANHCGVTGCGSSADAHALHGACRCRKLQVCLTLAHLHLKHTTVCSCPAAA
jgi:hypothetical protein